MAALSIILHSAGYDRAHYALVMATAAAALGRPVILFVTGGALAMLEDGDGWHRLGAADDGSPAPAREAAYAAANVATLAEMLEALAPLGVRVIACEMGWRVLALDRGQPHGPLRPDLPVEVAGMVTLLRDTPPGGQLVYV